LQATIQAAANDSTIAKILLEFDTPGGSVYGMSELADTIFQARQQKPVIGIANSLSASAGYWAMAQCSEVYCTPSGEVGSIGVYAAHQYIGAALEKEGIVTTLISEGRFKTEGNPFDSLGEEARSAIQMRIAEYYGAFVDAVAHGRGTTAAKVKSGMGQGRVLGAKDALAAGMIDGIQTFAALLDELVAANPPPKPIGGNRRAMALRELDLLET
jgi:signal peptide peptidase SppA